MMSNISSANRGDRSQALDEEGTACPGFVAEQLSSESWCSIPIRGADMLELRLKERHLYCFCIQRDSSLCNSLVNGFLACVSSQEVRCRY